MTILLKHGIGWHLDSLDRRDFMYAAPSEVLVSLPTSVDLRAKCPPVYDQGQLGSCVSNAVAGAIEYDQIRQAIIEETPSRLFGYYNTRVMEGTVSNDAGARIRDAVKSANKQGACPESEWPYDITKFADEPPIQCYTDATKQRALKYQRVLQNLYQMKACLASGLPFVFGVSVYPSFMSDSVASTGIVPMPGVDEAPIGGHALLMVGFEDSTQQFIFRNSWGTGWNPNDAFPGTGYISYAYVTDPNLAADLWTIQVIS